MVAAHVTHTPVAPRQDEATALAELLGALNAGRDHRAHLVIGSSDPERVEVPNSVLEVMRRAAAAMARGNAVAVRPVGLEVSTQQAMELLNVSRPFLNQLLQQGVLPYHHQGPHRRLRLRDVMRFVAEREERRREAYRSLLGVELAEAAP